MKTAVLLLIFFLSLDINNAFCQEDYSSDPEANHVTGKQSLNKGDFITALNYFKKAETQFKNANKLNKLANEWNSIAVIYNILEDFPQAFSYYSKALDYYTKVGDKEMEGVVLSNLGNIYFKLGEYEKARKHYKAAIRMFPKASANDLAITFGSISNTFMREGFYDSALFYNLKADAFNQMAPDSTFKGRLLINSSIIYKNLGLISNAYACIDSAIAIYESMDAPMLIGDVLLSKAKLLAETGKKTDALQTSIMAESFLLTQAAIAPLTDCYDVMAQLASETGDFEKAWNYSTQHRFWNDSLIKINNKNELTSLETKHTLKLKEEELINTKESENLYRIMVLLLSLLTIILISSVAYILNRRQKLAAAYNKLVQKQKEISEYTLRNTEIKRPLQEENKPDLELEFKLDHLMRHEKVYITEQLTLEQLAKLLGTNRNELSNHINKFHQKHFNNYLNQFRINDVVSRLIAGEHHSMTLEAIARAAGFSNRTSFHLAFRKETGVTPKYFIQTIDVNAKTDVSILGHQQ